MNTYRVIFPEGKAFVLRAETLKVAEGTIYLANKTGAVAVFSTRNVVGVVDETAIATSSGPIKLKQ